MQIVLTSHAKERMGRRKVSLRAIEETLSSPDKSFAQEDNLNYKFIKTIDGRQYQVIGHYNKDQDKWIIVSTWVRGEEDPPDYLWLIVTAPFRLLWWIVKNLCLLAWQAVKKLITGDRKKPSR